jgi:hypothetical protein
MFEILSNGTEYVIASGGNDDRGWSSIDAAGTLEEAYAKAKRNWDHYWSLCGLIPSRAIKISVAPQP